MPQERDDRQRPHDVASNQHDHDDDAIDLDDFELGSADDDVLNTIIVPGEEDELDAELNAESQARLDEKLPLQSSLEELLQGTYRLALLPGLSDLSRAEVEELRSAWPNIPDDLRESLVRDIAEIGEEEFDYNYERFLHVAIDDPNPVIRQLAITGLWLDDSEQFMETLIRLLHTDESLDVRAQAVSSLGPFAELSEFEELSAEVGNRVRETLYPLAQDTSEPQLVRRRALEAAAIFNTDPRLGPLIEEMHEEDDVNLRVTAFFAMGRSGNPRWLSTIINGFAEDDVEIRYEAARAAGNLGEAEAVPELSELIRQEEDAEVRQVAVTALGSIGGPLAMRVLHRLLERDETSSADAEAIQVALEEAALLSDPLFLEEEGESPRA